MCENIKSLWSVLKYPACRGAYWKILNDGWYDVQAVEWRRKRRQSGDEFQKDILRESKVVRIQVQNDFKRGAQRLDLRLANKV